MKVYGGYLPRKGDVILYAREGKPLLRMMGLKYRDGLRYKIHRVVLHSDDEVTVVYQDMKGMWILFLIYIVVIGIGHSADYYTQKMISDYQEKDIHGKVSSIIDGSLYEELLDKQVAAGNENNSQLFVDNAGDGGYLLINSDRPWISFTYGDDSGIGFGYEVYVDGKLFEVREYSDEKRTEEYQLTLYGRLTNGEHEVRIITFCYAPGESVAFDQFEKRLDILVE